MIVTDYSLRVPRFMWSGQDAVNETPRRKAKSRLKVVMNLDLACPASTGVFLHKGRFKSLRRRLPQAKEASHCLNDPSRLSSLLSGEVWVAKHNSLGSFQSETEHQSTSFVQLSLSQLSRAFRQSQAGVTNCDYCNICSLVLTSLPYKCESLFINN